MYNSVANIDRKAQWRTKYLKELMRYISIDSYGSCLNTKVSNYITSSFQFEYLIDDDELLLTTDALKEENSNDNKYHSKIRVMSNYKVGNLN